ncbi:hypothetical protein PIB30_102469, partial [Stylosanthes scabra]|nr:hypothetical protein [Stylosanthes scabra]
EAEGSINKGRIEQKHHHSKLDHHAIRDPFTYNMGSLSIIHSCTCMPTYNAMYHVIRGQYCPNTPQITEAGRYTSQPHVIRGGHFTKCTHITEATRYTWLHTYNVGILLLTPVFFTLYVV